MTRIALSLAIYLLTSAVGASDLEFATPQFREIFPCTIDEIRATSAQPEPRTPSLPTMCRWISDNGKRRLLIYDPPGGRTMFIGDPIAGAETPEMTLTPSASPPQFRQEVKPSISIKPPR